MVNVSFILQWRIQDFPDGGTNPWVWTENLLFAKIFAKTWMKMKEIGPKGALGTDPPMTHWNKNAFQQDAYRPR